MFEDLLPSKAEFRKLATRNAHFAQNIRVSSLPRIVSAVYGNDGLITVDLSFDFNRRYQVEILGTIGGQLSLVCQRCLTPMDVSIDAKVSVVVVTTEEQAKELDKQFDPWITDEEWLDLNALVEDELLLSLPFASYHKPEDCGGKQSYQTTDDSANEALDSNKQNPFQVLSSFKTSNKE